MFSRHFQEIKDELSGASNDTLLQVASEGGWRKRLIDQGRKDPASLLDLFQMLISTLSLIVWHLPPIGSKYRRALVAQDILNRKDSIW